MMASTDLNRVARSPEVFVFEERAVSRNAGRVLECLRTVRRSVAPDRDDSPRSRAAAEHSLIEIEQEWRAIDRLIESRRESLSREPQESAVMVVRLSCGDDSLERMLCQLERDGVNTEWAEIFSRDAFGFGALRVHGPSSVLRSYAKFTERNRFFHQVVESFVKDDESGEDQRHRVVVRLSGHGDKPGLMLSVIAVIRRHSGVFAFEGNCLAIEADDFIMQFVASVEGVERVTSLIGALQSLAPTHGITVEFTRLEPARSRKSAVSVVPQTKSFLKFRSGRRRGRRGQCDDAKRERNEECIPEDESAVAACW